MWLVAVIVSCIINDAFGSVVLKRIASKDSRMRRISWNFFFCTCFAIAIGVVAGGGVPTVDRLTLTFVVIGIANSFAAYCKWRAVKLSMSKSYLMTQGDDLIAMGLAFFFLNEEAYLTGRMILAITLCLMCAVAYTIVRREPGKSEVHRIEMLTCVLGYSIIWGIVLFCCRYYALQGLTIPNFLLGWYSGSYVGSLIMRVFGGATEAGKPLVMRDVGYAFMMAAIMLSSLAAMQWANQLAPIIVTQPVFQVSEMVVPTMIGLIGFKEGTGLRPVELALLLGSFAGILLVATSY